MAHTDHPKILVYIATSIDGFIARKDGSLDWLESLGDASEDYGFKSFINGIDTVILGRKTYEVAVTAYETENWPYLGKKLIILSSTLKNVIPEARLYAGDLVTLTQELYDKGSKQIWIDGGKIISEFLELNLVDEVILSLIPVLLGSGIPLFTIKKEHPCHLISAHSFPSGLVQIKYKVGEKVPLIT